MEEWNPFAIDEFSWETLKLYLKYGFGEVKLYNITFFNCNLNDETALLTLEEFAERVTDFDGILWKEKEEGKKE